MTKVSAPKEISIFDEILSADKHDSGKLPEHINLSVSEPLLECELANGFPCIMQPDRDAPVDSTLNGKLLNFLCAYFYNKLVFHS